MLLASIGYGSRKRARSQFVGFVLINNCRNVFATREKCPAYP